jgi:hypothetical protein
MNATDENTGGLGSHELCSGKYAGARVSDLDREELVFEARRGCSQYGDRTVMRLYISAHRGRRLWFDGEWERRGQAGLGIPR